ncbi:MAG: histidine kinase, partial [Ginsengibacter sp.]
SQINMEGCMAAAIKLGKISFIKQKEIDLLKNEKIKLQTEKGNSAMQPAFLADIISRVELVVMQKPVDIPNVLRKINELLINVTYEHTNAKVSLLKEIKLVREYIELEQCTREEVIEVNLNISGNMESESIASFILLQCIENAFNKVSVLNVSNKKIDIKISVVNKMLEMLISWNKPMDTSTLIEGNNIILRNLNNRLKLIYPQSHEIRVLIEIEKIIVSLKIDLKGAII